MAEPTIRKGDVFLIVERGRFPYDLRIAGIRQKDPALEPGQRAVRIRLEMDDAIWDPKPTPGTTIRVHAPISPEPEILVLELPQSDLADRPEDWEANIVG